MKQITRPKRIIVKISAENDARIRAAADASKRTITDVVEAGAMREVRRIEGNMKT